MPEKFETFSYEFEEETFLVICADGFEPFAKWNHSIFWDLRYLEDALRYARTGKSKMGSSHLGVFLSSLGRGREKLKIFTESYVTNLFYQLLCSTDLVCEAFQKQESIEKIIEKAVENNGGRMINGARYGKVKMLSPYVGEERELIVILELVKQKGKGMHIRAHACEESIC